MKRKQQQQQQNKSIENYLAWQKGISGQCSTKFWAIQKTWVGNLLFSIFHDTKAQEYPKHWSGKRHRNRIIRMRYLGFFFFSFAYLKEKKKKKRGHYIIKEKNAMLSWTQELHNVCNARKKCQAVEGWHCICPKWFGHPQDVHTEPGGPVCRNHGCFYTLQHW